MAENIVKLDVWFDVDAKLIPDCKVDPLHQGPLLTMLDSIPKPWK